MAAASTTRGVTASSAAAVTGEPFTFSSGVAKFGTTSPTTVTLNSASTFSVAATEGNASGNLTYGSCIFTVTTSTFPVGSKLAQGAKVEVTPCDLQIPTAGVSVDAAAAAKAVTFLLGTATSQPVQLTVDVTPTGQVVVNGVTVATVQLTTVTGGSGS